MPPPPSATDKRLHDTIAKRMRMSHISQPLMLMELLSHGFARQQPAVPRHRTWPGGSWKRMVGGEEVFAPPPPHACDCWGLGGLLLGIPHTSGLRRYREGA